MSNYTPQQLREIYQKLPEDVKDAIFSVDTSEIIREIGEKHKLMIDKIGELADETGLVMLGLTHPNEFISHLTERLEVEHEIAKEIAEDINSKVFFPIRENLKKIHGIEKTEEEISKDRPSESAPEVSVSMQKISPVPPLPTPEPKIEIPVPPEPKPEPKITTPPVIMSMPIDLTKAGKTQTEAPPADFGTKTREEFFRSLENKIEKTEEKTEEKEEKSEAGTPEIKKVDPYREPTL